MLDYGCGEATSADLVAAAAAHLTLVEAAPNVRAALDGALRRQPENLGAHARRGGGAAGRQSSISSCMHSVAQYLSAAELERLLKVFRALVKPDGLVIVGDIVPPQFAAPDAALALLRFAIANGFFWAAVGGLMRIFVSDYLRLKKTVGLSHYDEAAMLEKLKAAGFAAKRAPRNIGHNQRRMTFLARPA